MKRSFDVALPSLSLYSKSKEIYLGSSTGRLSTIDSQVASLGASLSNTICSFSILYIMNLTLDRSFKVSYLVKQSSVHVIPDY